MRKYIICGLLLLVPCLCPCLWGFGIFDFSRGYVCNDTIYYVLLDSKLIPPGARYGILERKWFLEKGGILTQNGIIKIGSFLRASYKKEVLKGEWFEDIKISEIVEEIERNVGVAIDKMEVGIRIVSSSGVGLPKPKTGDKVYVGILFDTPSIATIKVETKRKTWYELFPFEVKFLWSWGDNPESRDEEETWDEFVEKLKTESICVENLNLKEEVTLPLFSRLAEESLIWEKCTVTLEEVIEAGEVSYVRVWNSIWVYLHLGDIVFNKEKEVM